MQTEPPSSVSKNTKVRAERGSYTFDDFILTSKPNTRVNVTFTSNAIDSYLIYDILKFG